MKTAYEVVKAWRAANPDKVAAQARRYRAKHPDKIRVIKGRYREKNRERLLPIEAEQAAARRKRDPAGERRRQLAWQQRKEARLERIAGRPRAHVCELCSSQERTVFDHCHVSGEFRGWICDRCNKTLGLVKDSPALLRALAAYLEGHSHVAIDRRAA